MSKSKPNRILRVFRVLNAFILVGSFGIAGFMYGGYESVRATLPDNIDFTQYRPPGVTEIYSTERGKDGEMSHTLLARIATEDRTPVSLTRVPLHLRRATVAIEDERFYEHRGIDPKGIMRAALANFQSGRIEQGGSTISQQLVKNVWLTQDRTMDRKLKEVLLAMQFEQKFSKDELLEMYLNEVYYGHGAYGVQSAAKTFFGKDVSKLTLGEAALLAGLPRRPSDYSPYNDPQACKQRRRVVLAKMAEMGFITTDQMLEAENEQIQSRLAPLEERGIAVQRAHHFTNLVVRELCADPRYGADVVYKGGLRIYTTLDMRLQEIAEDELSKQIEALRRRGGIRPSPVGQGALAAVDVHTGDVLAMVGGVGTWEQIQFNRAHPGPPQYGRQPGSSFKPYLFATAFESGYSPSSVFSGSSLTIGNWSPVNYSPGQGGNYTLQNALGQSVNLVAVRLIRAVGIEKTIRYASRMLNVPESRFPPYPSLALGVSELSPLEHALGYACFASGGWRPEKRLYHTIKDYTGELIEYRAPHQERVLSKPAAISMIQCMRYVVTSGTGRRASISGLACAGKTGTTQDNRDAWWVGYTPDLSCAVWVGNDDNQPMRGASGGGFAAPVWREFIRRSTDVLGLDGKYPEGTGVSASRRGETRREREEEKPEETRPDTPQPVARRITICTASGGAAGPYCPDTVERSLAPGEAGPGRCTIHRGSPSASSGSSGSGSSGSSSPGGRSEPSGGSVTVTVCTQTGQAAGPYCPDTVERSFPAGAAPGRCTAHGGSAPRPQQPDPPAPTPPAEPAGGDDGEGNGQ
ncbi:MAG: PBP1A family penicillin-binding protein [candidate division WS1 bacterium]|jgi:penicillin-binding protein 1A|nr:PBP1A family penicillin-binding protein [candidate division WS1 bacterium]